jgi:hypothetical protein
MLENKTIIYFQLPLLPNAPKVFVCQTFSTPEQNGNKQQKLFPKLLYIMWHYRAIKKNLITFKSGHSPIITLCKKAAHPTLESPAPATHFFRFPLTTQLQKTRGFAGLTLCFHKNVYPSLESHNSKNVTSFVFIN